MHASNNVCAEMSMRRPTQQGTLATVMAVTACAAAFSACSSSNAGVALPSDGGGGGTAQSGMASGASGTGAAGSGSGATASGASGGVGTGSGSGATASGASGAGGTGSGSGASTSGTSAAGGNASGSSGTASGTSGTGSAATGASGTASGSSGAGGLPVDAGVVITHTAADCDTLAAGDGELVLPLTKTKVTKPALPATPTDASCILAAAVSGPSEAQAAADTARIKAALSACSVVKLVSAGAMNAFISGPQDIVGPGILWVDTGVTLYASVNADSFAYSGRTSCGAKNFDEDCEATGGTQCTALINMTGNGPQLVGGGTIDGQGGKPLIVGGTQQTYSWWDLSVALREDSNPDAGVNPGNCGSTPASQRGGSAPNPQLIIGGASTTGKSDKNTANLVVAGLILHNSPKFHIKFASNGFNIWGNTILTPSDKSVPPINARNTDGIDPGEGYLATSGSIVCNMVSTGDDDVVLKGHYGVGNVVVAHNHFGTGHGMSIGSETQGIPGLTSTDTAGTSTTPSVGIQDVDIYDISIDADTRATGGAPGSDINGVRVKSDTYRGGIVQNVTFHDICARDIVNPLIINPHYSDKTTTPPEIPFFKSLTVRNLESVLGLGLDGPVTPLVTLEGFDAMHPTNITLDNVLIQGIQGANVFSDANSFVTFGAQGANFAAPPSAPSAKNPPGIACDWGWPVPRPQ
jgi:polygalacturonase